MHIERATIEDAEDILVLQRQEYQSEGTLYDDPTIPPLTQTLDSLRAEFADHIILKATLDGRLVGSVRARPLADTAYIGRLVVRSDSQKQGIGTQLMRAIEQACSTATRFELFTGHKSERNLALYRKLGYREFKREPVHAALTMVYLEKVVGHMYPSSSTSHGVCSSA